MANVNNYTEQGGNKTVIGGEILITGKISIDENAQTEGFPSYTLPTASDTTKGGVKIGSGLTMTGEVLSADSQVTPAANQAASVASDVAGIVADFNALLTKLKTAGLMTADTVSEPEQEDEGGGE